MLDTTWTALACILAGLCLYCAQHFLFNSRPKNGATLPPSPFALPIIGHWFLLLPFNVKYMTQLSQELGSVFMLRVFHLKFLFLNTGAAIKGVIVNNSEVFDTKHKPPESWIHEHTKYSFLFIDGPASKEKRRFTLHHLRNFGFGKMAMQTTIMDEFNRLCVVLDKHDGQKMQIKNYCFTTIVNVLWGVIAGKTFEYDETLEKLINAIHGIFTFGKVDTLIGQIGSSAFKYIPGDPFNERKLQNWMKTVTTFIEDEIDEHAKTLSAGEPRDYIDAYLMEIKKHEGTRLTNGNECFTQRHLVSGITDLLNAGIETSSGTMEWALLYMVVWPEIQDKVRLELDNVIGRNRRPTYSDMPMLPYVKATVMEIHRFASMVACCSMRVSSQTTTIMNYTIPKGTMVILNLYAAHRDKETWGDPDVFRPERFITDENKMETSDSLIPFSIGPRNCVGEPLARMEVFLLLTGLMQRYSFHRVPGEPMPSIEPIFGHTLVPKPFDLVVKRRP